MSLLPFVRAYVHNNTVFYHIFSTRKTTKLGEVELCINYNQYQKHNLLFAPKQLCAMAHQKSIPQKGV